MSNPSVTIPAYRQRKHRYAKNKMDFSFARICDMHPVGGRVEGEPIVSVISPMADEYAMYNDPKCVLESSNEGGQIIIRLRDDGRLDRELRTYAQTEKYLKNKSDTGLPESTKRILRDNAEDNRGRREVLTGLLGDILTEASYFAAGQQITPKGSALAACLDEALEYLISNTFSKMGYRKHLHPDPSKRSRPSFAAMTFHSRPLHSTLKRAILKRSRICATTLTSAT